MNPFISSELATLRERSLRPTARRRRAPRRDETLFRAAPDSDLA
jgi:hypothetical protein